MLLKFDTFVCKRGEIFRHFIYTKPHTRTLVMLERLMNHLLTMLVSSGSFALGDTMNSQLQSFWTKTLGLILS